LDFQIGVKVAKSLKLGHDGVSHAAIDMLCTLMEPMHEDFDLKQEQLNKSSLLSSDRFLDGLLDMWTTHVVSFFLTLLLKSSIFLASGIP
jgi:DnaJ family protein C protein 13